jgi:hypothetical protein
MKLPFAALALCAVTMSAHAQWHYTAERDEMTDKLNRTAVLQSSNKVDLSFPYGSGTKGHLQIQQQGDDEAHVLFWIDNGQLVCGIGGCQVELRFDGGEVEKITALPPKGYGSDGLFLEPEAELIQRLIKTKHLLLRAFFYQDGDKVFQFSPQGLKWPPPTSTPKR